MSDIKIVVRTADHTRKAEVSMSRANTGGDVIQAAVDNWSLPTETDYTLVNASNGNTIRPDDALVESIVADGDTLEVQPVLVAG